MIDSPGVYKDIPPAAYHADPCPEPSLSASLIDRLLERSPAHARAAHPRFVTPEVEEFRFSLGDLVHNLLLGGRRICVIDAKSYQGKDAKAARDAALEAGETPVLLHQLHRAERVRNAILGQLKDHPELSTILEPPAVFEATVAWQEDSGLWCRCRPDILFDREIYDLKITGVAATPEAWGASHAWRMGYARRAVWYRRGLRKAHGVMPRYFFVVVEDEPPYAISHFECSPEALDIATREIEQALAIWTRCMETGEWPSYSTDLQWINPPNWAHYRSEEVLARHAFSVPQDETQAPYTITPETFGV